MSESWTEQEIRVAFIGGRMIHCYPDTFKPGHTFGSLMYQLRRRRAEEEKMRPIFEADEPFVCGTHENCEWNGRV